jgi:hypothetical protein
LRSVDILALRDNISAVPNGNSGAPRIKAAALDGGQSGAAPIYAARAWVNFNGTGTVTIRASGNVSSVTDLGTGLYTINFSVAMPDTNYALSGMGKNTANAGAGTVFLQDPELTTSGATIETGAVAGSLFRSDLPVVTLSFFR